jgi:hypothetical protein
MNHVGQEIAKRGERSARADHRPGTPIRLACPLSRRLDRAVLGLGAAVLAQPDADAVVLRSHAIGPAVGEELVMVRPRRAEHLHDPGANLGFGCAQLGILRARGLFLSQMASKIRP